MSCYGGLIETPNIDRIAANGLRYTQWHTTALCSPTRSCLLTGRNHTTTGWRASPRPRPVSQRQRTHPAGVRDRRRGAGRAGLLHCDRRQVAPVRRGRDEPRVDQAGLAAGTRLRPLLRLPRRRDQPVVPRPGSRQPPGGPAEPPRAGIPPQRRPDRPCDRVHRRRQDDRARPAGIPVLRAGCCARPAPGAPRVGRSIPWPVRHGLRGDARGDPGPAEEDGHRPGRTPSCRRSTRSAPRRPAPARTGSRSRRWTTPGRGTACQPTSSRSSPGWPRCTQASCRTATHQIGRLLDYLEEIGELDNTIIIVVSDNGASGEGGPNGSVNENIHANGLPDDHGRQPRHDRRARWAEDLQPLPHRLGDGLQHPVQDVEALLTQRRHRDPCIVSWPAGIKARGEIRDQYHHAIDIVPTLLDCLGVPEPDEVRGVTQIPVRASACATASTRAIPTAKKTQFYSMLGTRASGTTAGRRSPPTPRSAVGATSGRTTGSCTTPRSTAPSSTTSPPKTPTSSPR